ncbi:MAG: zinc ribbon domain-containing protein [Promethearchaeota archaeon]|nr:MAG: zinc ribbon domain-containing protein [Candidatus Lokiarchaeota archaeon]
MSYPDYNQMFQCPSCGAIGNIFLLKVSGPQIIVKQRCPTHGGRTFKIPLKDLDEFLDPIRDGVFRCYQCGQPATPGPVKFSGAYAVLNCVCQVPGHSSKTQKIWSTIYVDITEHSPKTPEKDQHYEAPVVKTKTPPKKEVLQQCPNCGTKLEGNEKFCGTCGFKL